MSDQQQGPPPSPGPPVDLAPVLAEGLSRALRVQLRTELAADDGYPPGAQDYFAQFSLGYELESGQRLWDPEAAAVLELADQMGLPAQDGGSVTFPIGYAEALVVDFVNGSFDALDARGTDEARLGADLFYGGHDGDGLQSELEAFDEHAVLLKFATIEPRFRGHGLSLTALGLMLDELSRGCICVLLDPMLPGTTGNEARASARAGLARHWARLGFVDYGDDGLMLLDLGLERPPLVRSN